MTDRDAPHKNPARVPMVLQAMDDPAAHDEPRHILSTEGPIMARTRIEKSGIYKDANGNQFYMSAGYMTTREVEYIGPRGGTPEARAITSPAPENKARQAAPETKGKKAE